jgi:glycosyltransferase involved in cell wall biosynthesis
MKILHVCAIGITARKLLRSQIDYFLSQGFEVDITCSPDADSAQLQQAGYCVYPVPIDRKIDWMSNLKSVIQLTRLMKANQYDLVHVHTPIAAVLGRIAAKLAGVKCIVYTAHGFPFHDQSSPLQYRVYFTIEQICARLTDLILTQNYEDWITAQKQGLCPPQKVRVLGNGVDIERFNRDRLNSVQQQQLRASLGIPNTANLLVGIVGRLTRQKGSQYLIEAIAKLLPQFPHLHVLVIGSQLSTDREPLHDELIRQIQQLQIADHVTFTGFRDDVPELLGLLDIFTLPTFFGEGLPRSILEAMAMSLPVVTTDIRGCREAVIHGKTGLIVPPKDSDRLAEALQTLLAEPALRRAYGQASRQRVEAEYDERFVFQRLAEVYHEMSFKLSSKQKVEGSRQQGKTVFMIGGKR